MDKLMLSLANDLDKLQAKNAHATMNNIKHTQGLTGVISVYKDTKPSHMVLDELYGWAEKEHPEVAKKIEELESDMTWNKENPI